MEEAAASVDDHAICHFGAGNKAQASKAVRLLLLAGWMLHDYWRGGACEHPAIISFIGKNKTQWRVRAQERARVEARRMKE